MPRDRSSPTSSWPMRSIAPRQNTKQFARSDERGPRFLSTIRPILFNSRSWSLRLKIRRSITAFPLPESQWTGSLCGCVSDTRHQKRKRRCWTDRHHCTRRTKSEPVLNAQHILDLQAQVDKVRMEDSLMDYLLAIVLATRQNPLFSLGVSTRGARAQQSGEGPRPCARPNLLLAGRH